VLAEHNLCQIIKPSEKVSHFSVCERATPSEKVKISLAFIGSFRMNHHKVVLVGDTGVGKTCITGQVTTGSFELDHSPTIGADHVVIRTLAGTDVSLDLWDTAGQDQYRSMLPMYFRGTHAVIIIFDVTKRSSFESVERWVSTVKKIVDNDNCELVLLGNKADLTESREVTFDEGENEWFKVGAAFFREVSAKTGQNIHAVLETLAEHLGGKQIEDEPKPEADELIPVSEGSRSWSLWGC
jgi:Ras-related protein Rab-6A